MSDNHQRYSSIKKALLQMYPEAKGQAAKTLNTMAAMISGIVGSKSTHYGAIASKTPDQAKLESRIKRFSRWVNKSGEEVTLEVMPFAKALLEGLAKQTLVLVMDGSEVGRKCLALMVSVVYHGRALPVAWLVVKGNKGHRPEDEHILLAEKVYELVPTGADVAFLGDGEFDGSELQAALSGFGWIYVCRTASNTILDVEGEELSFQSLSLHPGEHISLPEVLFTRQHYGPIHAIAWWRKGYLEPIYLVSNLELVEEACYWYAKRFRIEIVCTQLTKAGVFTTWTGWDNVADFYFFIINDHSIYQQFYQLPALFKAQIIQSWLNMMAELIDVVCQCKCLNLPLGLLLQLSQLLLKTVLGLRQFLTFSLKFISHDDFRQVHFQKTILLTIQTCQGLANGVAFGLQGLRQPFSCLGAFQFMGNQVRLGYNVTEILPNKFIQCQSRRIAGCATFTLSGSMNITSSTASVVVVSPLITTGRRQTALATTNQAAEQGIVALVVATCHILVLLQARLGSIKHFLIDDSWNRDCNPLLWGGWPDAFTPPDR